MRIALITDGIAPYVIGGMQKHSFYLAKYFAKNKIYVDLIHYNNSNLDISKLECFTESEKSYINSIVLDFPQNINFPGHYILSSYQYSVLAFNKIQPTLKEYDFIYTKGFSGWKLINEKYKGNINCCKIGVKFHGYEMFQIAPDFKSKIQQYLLKPFVKKITLRADIVFSYGGKITDIIKSLKVKSSKIVEIPSGVEKEMISGSISEHHDNSIKFVFLGRYERRKGIIELNEILKRLILQDLPFKFEFIGPIPEDKKISHQHITYHGEIREPKIIKQILQQADVLVCPSWSEGFPNVILEGMANGLAIIATDVGAVSALVNEDNGWLIEPGQNLLLEKAMKEAINSYKNLNVKKQNSLDVMVSTFNWDKIFDKIISNSVLFTNEKVN